MLLPLLAGGGWEGVKLLIFMQQLGGGDAFDLHAKSDPTPTLPCK